MKVVRGVAAGIVLAAGAVGTALAAPAGNADVTVAVDGAKRTPISPYIYGVNFRGASTWGARIPTGLLTLDRMGGNRLSAWNWETNDSNCGNDCGKSFRNDAYLATPANAPGSAVKVRADADLAAGLAFLATVPTIGAVAADHAGDVPVPVAPDTTRPADPGPRFLPMRPRNPAGPTAKPDLADGAVYADDLVAWMKATYPRRTVFYGLDNEPDLWGSTHAEIGGRTASGAGVPAGFDELVTKSVATAAAIKSVDPSALVFGPAISGWYGFHVLGRTPSEWSAARSGAMQWYLDYYLARMNAASAKAGVRLLDVLDVHWYPEATNACTAPEKAAGCYMDRITNDWQRTKDGKAQWPSVIEARVQAPRALWDPTYVERSWISRTLGGRAIELLPRLRRSIDAFYPGTRIAITEYYYGRAGDISGAVAQADLLGVFAREGVFAATMWPNANAYAWTPLGCGGKGAPACLDVAYGCAWSAFKAYRDYDGAGGRFGETLVRATVSDDGRISAYASTTSSGAVLVVLNKTQAPLDVAIALENLPAYARASAWQVTGTFGSCTDPVPRPDPALARDTVALRVPALSITTVALSR